MTTPIQIKSFTLGKGIPKICVPLTGGTKEALCCQARAAVSAGADLAEWRADCFQELFSLEKLEHTLSAIDDILGQIPLLFTIRTQKEGGNCTILSKDYVNLNKAAAASGKVSLMDVEVFHDREANKALITELHALGVKVIASSHDFEKTDPCDVLVQRFRDMETSGADILKMAVMPRDFGDTAAIMQATWRMQKEFTKKPLVSMAMGGIGGISRIAGEAFGSCITFGTVGEASAPGQFPIAELRGMLESLHSRLTA